VKDGTKLVFTFTVTVFEDEPICVVPLSVVTVTVAVADVALGIHACGNVILADVAAPVTDALLEPMEYVTVCVKFVDALEIVTLPADPVVKDEGNVNDDALGIVVSETVVAETEPPVMYVDVELPLSHVPLMLIDFEPSAL